MGAQQSGGRLSGPQWEKKEKRKENRDRYERVKEQVGDISKAVFIDLPPHRVLKRLGLDSTKKIKNIIVDGHGELYDTKNPEYLLDVPDNIVVMYLGELGRLTMSYPNQSGCNLTPSSIALPGTTIPNVKVYSSTLNNNFKSGIYVCNDDGETQTKFKTRYRRILQAGDESRVSLEDILNEISEQLPEDTYGFVKVYTCLGACDWLPKNTIDIYRNKLDDKIKPYYIGREIQRVETRPPEVIVASDNRRHFVPFNPTDDKRLHKIRKNLFDAIKKGAAHDFYFWTGEFTDKYPSLELHDNVVERLVLLSGLDEALLSFYIRHTLMIRAIVAQDKPAIKDLWDSSFQDENSILLPLKYYIKYAKNNNLFIWKWMQSLEQLPWFDSIKSIVGMLEDYKGIKQVPQRKVRRVVRRRGNHSGGAVVNLNITEQMVCF